MKWSQRECEHKTSTFENEILLHLFSDSYFPVRNQMYAINVITSLRDCTLSMVASHMINQFISRTDIPLTCEIRNFVLRGTKCKNRRSRGGDIKGKVMKKAQYLSCIVIPLCK